MAGMTMSDEYLPSAVREFRRLKQLADRSIAQSSNESFFARPAAGDNSIAVMVKHLSGNLRSRWKNFLTADGEKPDRVRDQEFVVTDAETREALLVGWEEGWAILFREMEPLTPADLARVITIRHESMTALQAIQRQLTHYAYHVGQIVYVAKHFAGANWQTLSIPLGKSEEFNRVLAAKAKRATG